MYRNNVVWELRVSETDELITTYENKWLECFEFKKQPKGICEKIKKIVSKYGTHVENYSDWYSYIATIGKAYSEDEDDEEYKTLEEFRRYESDFSDYPLYFLKTIQREEYDSPADYYTVQKEYDYDEGSYVVASYRTFEEAEKYCKENNISVNNIIPETFGDEFVELCDI